MSFLIGVGAVLFNFGRIALAFLTPRQKPNQYGAVIQCGSLSDLPEAAGVPKLVPEGRFWLVNAKNGILALHSSCTHLECRFSWNEQRNVFLCPCHGSEFSIDGTLLKGPADRPLDRFQIVLATGDGAVVRTSGDKAEPVPVNDLLQSSLRPSEEAEITGETKQIVVRVDTGRKIAGRQSS